MELFQVSFDEFKKQVNLWNINSQGKERVELEETGNYFVFYLCLPYKTYVCVVSKEELSNVDKMILFPISVRSKRVNQRNYSEKLLEAISEKINKMQNATTTTIASFD